MEPISVVLQNSTLMASFVINFADVFCDRVGVFLRVECSQGQHDKTMDQIFGFWKVFVAIALGGPFGKLANGDEAGCQVARFRQYSRSY